MQSLAVRVLVLLFSIVVLMAAGWREQRISMVGITQLRDKGTQDLVGPPLVLESHM